MDEESFRLTAVDEEFFDNFGEIGLRLLCALPLQICQSFPTTYNILANHTLHPLRNCQSVDVLSTLTMVTASWDVGNPRQFRYLSVVRFISLVSNIWLRIKRLFTHPV